MNKINMKYLQKMKIKYTNKFFYSKMKNEKMMIENDDEMMMKSN